jgi:hypothetical protein
MRPLSTWQISSSRRYVGPCPSTCPATVHADDDARPAATYSWPESTTPSLDDICAVSISGSVGNVWESAVTADFVALRAASRSRLVAADVL